jgi:hypothetical protein
VSVWLLHVGMTTFQWLPECSRSSSSSRLLHATSGHYSSFGTVWCTGPHCCGATDLQQSDKQPYMPATDYDEPQTTYIQTDLRMPAALPSLLLPSPHPAPPPPPQTPGEAAAWKQVEVHQIHLTCMYNLDAQKEAMLRQRGADVEYWKGMYRDSQDHFTASNRAQELRMEVRSRAVHHVQGLYAVTYVALVWHMAVDSSSTAWLAWCGVKHWARLGLLGGGWHADASSFPTGPATESQCAHLGVRTSCFSCIVNLLVTLSLLLFLCCRTLPSLWHPSWAVWTR